MVKTIGPKADQLEWLKTTGPKADRLWAALEGGDGVGPTLLREFFGGRSRLHAMVSDLERYYRGERECARIRHQEANNPNRVEDSGLRGDRESIISITSSEPPGDDYGGTDEEESADGNETDSNDGNDCAVETASGVADDPVRSIGIVRSIGAETIVYDGSVWLRLNPAYAGNDPAWSVGRKPGRTTDPFGCVWNPRTTGRRSTSTPRRRAPMGTTAPTRLFPGKRTKRRRSATTPKMGKVPTTGRLNASSATPAAGGSASAAPGAPLAVA